MLIEYYPGKSSLHRLDVRTKILGFLVLTILSFISETPMMNMILAVAAFDLLMHIRAPLGRIWHIIKPLLPIFLVMIIITGFTYQPTGFRSELEKKVIFCLLPGWGAFTVGGVLWGISLSLRIMVMVLGSTLVTFTTPIEDILQFLKKLRMPHQLAFVIATGIRFIPTMQKKAEMIQEAQLARGAEFGGGGIIKKIKSFIPILIPLIVDSLRMSDNLAISMLNRGFGAMKTTTDLYEIKMHMRDYLVSALLLLIVTGMILLKIYKLQEF
ncbi:MAG: energy-coupling factor transporter transmembrane component T family protein [Ignavibacteriales bacterium]